MSSPLENRSKVKIDQILTKLIEDDQSSLNLTVVSF